MRLAVSQPQWINGGIAEGGKALRETHSVIVGIATAGRPTLVSSLVKRLERQTLRPSLILIAPANSGDVEPSLASDLIRIVHGRQGSCAQRNSIIEETIAHGGDVLVFFDDDFVPCDDYLEAMSAALLGSSAVLAGGITLADGAGSAGISLEDADRIIAAAPTAIPSTVPAQGAYGCATWRC